jgi:hypothetical protein
MRVYHYLEAKWALDDIRRRRLKVSKIDDLNDPYEFACVHSIDRASQIALDKTRSEGCEKYGALCFSRIWNSILMWSHYGDRHKGLCLGFDVLEDLVRPVEYVREVLAVGNLMFEELNDEWNAEGVRIVDRLLGGKYDGWSYEQEVREHAERAEMDGQATHRRCCPRLFRGREDRQGRMLG